MVVVKSLTRKTASYSQLLKYMNEGREENDNYCYKNIDSNDHYAIVKEYLSNVECLKKQKNSKLLFHDIISLKRQENLSIAEQREILKDLISQYIESWASNHLAYGVIHKQENTLHAHLMISSNEYRSAKNKRLSQKQFEEVKDRLSEYAYTKYPELEKVEFKKKQKGRRKARQLDKEHQFEKRTGRQSDRGEMKERLQAIFAQSHSPEQFIAHLQAENIAIYQRGQTWGFIDKPTGTKYRLKTLGLESEFERVNARLSQTSSEESHQREAQQEQERDTLRTNAPEPDHADERPQPQEEDNLKRYSDASKQRFRDEIEEIERARKKIKGKKKIR